ncbi:MAG: TrkH family potassium uptake protein [Legionellaceae bacterium]|nr:TrkH family potassium uptake protein [Legionellaceae bacterium]
MQYKTTFRLIGLLLIIFSPSMLTPLIINGIFHEDVWTPFIIAFALTFSTGSLLRFIFRKHQHELKNRDGFLIVVLFWLVLCFFASLPFLFAMSNSENLTDALFETVSGITTTGASVIVNIDLLPHAILFYRQQLQFIGGIGIVLLAVSILPMLGVGGMQLYRAETPGPMKDSKLTPRIMQTAKALWAIYVSLTLLCALCYWITGMDWFDAVGESFGTVSTGGFSMHSNSFAYYNSDAIILIASLFMFLSGTSFTLHFIAYQKRTLKYYWENEEFRTYVGIIVITGCFVTIALINHQLFQITPHTFVTSIFTIVSFVTTTGFDLNLVPSWPTFVPLLITILMLIGGCAASTSGGIKVLRALLIFKQSKRELVRLIHPQAIIPIKLGKQSLSESVLQSMWGFTSVFIATYILLMLIFMALGHDLEVAFAAITAGIANAGTGIGQFSVSFPQLDAPSKWVLIFAMLAGRLEIFSILILFTPQFWRK